MSGLLQARARGRSPGQDTSSESAEAVTEAERSEDPAIYWRRTAGILTTCVCCHDNWLLVPEEHMSNGVTTLLNFQLQSHFRLNASGEMLLRRRINSLRKTHWFFLYKCVNNVQNLQMTFRERRWRWPERNTSHTPHTPPPWHPDCTLLCWPLQMSSFETSVGAAAAARRRVWQPNADRHRRISWRHFNTERLRKNWVLPPVKDELQHFIHAEEMN